MASVCLLFQTLNRSFLKFKKGKNLLSDWLFHWTILIPCINYDSKLKNTAFNAVQECVWKWLTLPGKKNVNFVFSKESKLVSIYQYDILHRVSEITVDLTISWISLVAQMVKNLPSVPETWVWSLGQEDPLEKGMATHSSILAWRIPWTEEPGGLQSMGNHKEMDMTKRLSHTHYNPMLQDVSFGMGLCAWKLRTFIGLEIFNDN